MVDRLRDTGNSPVTELLDDEVDEDLDWSISPEIALGISDV